MSNLNPLVSIVIPVYNGSNYMKEAIDSALAQTYKNIEIIVVNDGSTDNTDEIAKSYGDKIRYFSKENGGVATALNLAIKEAKGEYISWLSHDDLYLPNKILRQIEELSKLKNKNTILFSDFILKNMKDNNEIQINTSELGYKSDNRENILKLLFNSSLHGCTLLIPKICFHEVGLFNTTLKTTQDYKIWFDFIKVGFDFKLIPEYLIIARQHSAQDTNNKKDLCIKEQKLLFRSATCMFFVDILKMNKDNFKSIFRNLKRRKLYFLCFILKICYLIKLK